MPRKDGLSKENLSKETLSKETVSKVARTVKKSKRRRATVKGRKKSSCGGQNLESPSVVVRKKKTNNTKDNTKDVTVDDRTENTKTIGNEDLTAEDENKNKSYVKYCDAEASVLLKKPWFHGLMPRIEIEEMLKNDGDFLVRKTDVGNSERLAISYKWNNLAKHMLFRLDDKKCWTLHTGVSFDTIEKLIEFYMTTKVEFKQDGAKILTPVNRPDWYILHEHISLKNKVGSGSFGDVYLAELMQDDKKLDVAVKTLRGKMGKKERASFVQEASLNRKLNHPNIVRLIGIAPQCDPLMVILELAPGGSLKSHVKEGAHTPAQLTKYLHDASKGLEYLTSVQIIHRDVAARNCLLSGDLTVKISDFGLSVASNELKDLKTQKVPVRWLAPETLRTATFSVKTDVWSFGVMMWEVYSLCKTEPYPGCTNAEAKKNILSGNLMEVPPNTPAGSAEVMKSCWKENPEERATFTEIVYKLSLSL